MSFVTFKHVIRRWGRSSKRLTPNTRTSCRHHRKCIPTSNKLQSNNPERSDLIYRNPIRYRLPTESTSGQIGGRKGGDGFEPEASRIMVQPSTRGAISCRPNVGGRWRFWRLAQIRIKASNFAITWATSNSGLRRPPVWDSDISCCRRSD